MLQPNTPTTPVLCAADKPQCVQITWAVPKRPRWQRALFGHGDLVEMRDTKLGDASPVARWTRVGWRRYLTRDVWTVSPAADRLFREGDLAYTRAEWNAFLDDVAAGQFDLPRAVPVVSTA